MKNVEKISDESKTVENEVPTEATDEITTVTPEVLIDDIMTNNINDGPNSDEIEIFLKSKNITKDTVDLEIYQQLISSLLKISSRLSEANEYVIDIENIFDYLFDPYDVEAFIEHLDIIASLIHEYNGNHAVTEEIVDEVIIDESLPVPATNLSNDTKTSEDMSETNNDIEKTTEPIAKVEKPVEITV